MRYIRTLTEFALRFIRRLLTPCVDSIVADFERKIAQLEKVIDAEYDEADAQLERRIALRRQIDDAIDAENAAGARAARASAIRNNLREIINA